MTYWMISKEQKKNKNSKPMPFWMGSPRTFWNYSRFGKWWESCVFFILLSAKLVTWVNFDSQDSWSGRSKKRKFKFLTYGMGENRKKNARFSLPWLSKSTVNPNTQQLKAWMMIRVSVSQSATSHPVTQSPFNSSCSVSCSTSPLSHTQVGTIIIWHYIHHVMRQNQGADTGESRLLARESRRWRMRSGSLTISRNTFSGSSR